jgi:hypothetical protein
MSQSLYLPACDNVLPAQIRKYFPYYALALAVFAAYSNIYFNQFLYDDDILIVGNVWLRSWDHLIELLWAPLSGNALGKIPFHRPLQSLLYFFVYQTFGLSTVAFHLLNVGCIR